MSIIITTFRWLNDRAHRTLTPRNILIRSESENLIPLKLRPLLMRRLTNHSTRAVNNLSHQKRLLRRLAKQPAHHLHHIGITVIIIIIQNNMPGHRLLRLRLRTGERLGARGSAWRIEGGGITHAQLLYR